MSTRGPNLSRRQDLQRAIKRAKPGDLLRLEDLARVWGVVKTRFVNVKNDVTMTIGFPEHAPGPNNTHLYPAKASLQKLLDWETRHDKISSDRQKRAAEILGHTRRGRAGVSEIAIHQPRELSELNRLAADIEQRERDQGLYIPASVVSATAGDVFSIVSEFCGIMENHVDPNGLLPPEVREKIAKGGRDTLLKVHQRMKGLLNADSAADQRPAGRARTPRARR